MRQLRLLPAGKKTTGSLAKYPNCGLLLTFRRQTSGLRCGVFCSTETARFLIGPTIATESPITEHFRLRHKPQDSGAEF